MTWSTTVHTPLSSDTEPSIIVTFESAKYVFNTTENTGRAFLQSNRNWRKTKALFFTQARVERTSGLAGLIMSFADATIDNLALYGPPGLTHILASARMYTFRDSINIQTTEIPWTMTSSSSPQPCYTDSNISVYAIPSMPVSEPLNPISESVVSADVQMLAPTELPEKRKRSASLESPRKRLNPGSSSPGRTPLTEDLLAEVRAKNFDPSTLTGNVADDYRRMLLRAMFPYTAPAPAMSVAQKVDQNKRSREGMKKQNNSRQSPPSPEVHENATIDVDTYRRSRASLPNGFHKQLPKFTSNLPPSDTPSTLSYLVVGPRYRGKFDVNKAKELGLAGPDRGRVARGETITIKVKEGENIVERMIRPEDVLGESETPGAILLLDVPSAAHIPSLRSAFQNSDFYSKVWSEDSTPVRDEDIILRAVYHICGDSVLEDETYKSFLNGFGPAIDHVVASREYCPDPVTFTSAAYNQVRLNKLDEKMFPIPKHSLTSRKDLASIPNLPPKIHPMQSGLHLTLRPYAPPTTDTEIAAIDKFHPVVSGASPIVFSSTMQRCVNTARAKVAERLERGDIPAQVGAQVGVVPLGTGGSLPSKYRNVLSTLIRIPEWGNILLDTGEGTWGQLARNYGLDDSSPYNAWQALRDLKCIFVSHIHGDHHIGLAHLLAKRRSLSPPPDHPVYVVSVRAVHLYLRELSDVQDLGLFDPSGNGVISVINESIHDRATGQYLTTGMWQVGGDEPWLDYKTSVENGRKMCEALGLESFKTVDVYHRCRCFGCAFKHKDGWKISFSGDTMPTDNLVRIGMNSTVVIHEATMGDDEADMAQRKSHSTIGQAIAMGKKMNAKHILLTHFSARYPKLPPSVTKETVEGGPDAKHLVLPAFDHCNMTIGDMWKMSYYLPALLRNFKETGIEEDEESRSRSSSPAPSAKKSSKPSKG